MAEGGRRSFTASSYKGSEEVFDFNCTPCSQDGNYVEAVVFCADCVELFCPPCNKQHKRFGLTSGHNVVSADQADQASSLLPTERCREHAGERISTYCAEHDMVVCSICLAIDHRACKGASYIPKIAGGQAQSKDRQQIKYEISQTIKAMSQVKVSIQDCQANMDTEKKMNMQQINDYTDDLIKHANDLKKAAVEDLDDHHKKATNELQSQMKSMDGVTAKMKDQLKRLNNTTNESQTFVDIKQSKKEVQTAKQLEESLKSSNLAQVKTIFSVEASVQTFLNDVNTLGNVIKIKPYKLVLSGRYDAINSEDKHLCRITDICELSDGRILVSDCANECIKLLNESNGISKSFQMPSWPWGICQTSKDQIAVTLMYSKKVQFVDVKGDWKLTRSFNLEENCREVKRSNDELFISCGGHHGNEHVASEGPGFVGIYDMSGTIIAKIQLDLRGNQIFSVPYHIAITHDNRKIHVADKKGGLITVDRIGHVLSKCSDNLQWAVGVCAVSDDSLIVCGSESNNVLQVDSNGKVVAEIANQTDGLKIPVSVSVVQNRSKLLVSFEDSSEIIIYDL